MSLSLHQWKSHFHLLKNKITSSVKSTWSQCSSVQSWYWWQKWRQSLIMRSVNIGFLAGLLAFSWRVVLMAFFIVVKLRCCKLRYRERRALADKKGSRSRALFIVSRLARVTIVGWPGLFLALGTTPSRRYCIHHLLIVGILTPVTRLTTFWGVLIRSIPITWPLISGGYGFDLLGIFENLKFLKCKRLYQND